MSASSSVPGEFIPGSGVPGNPGTSAPPPGWPPFYTTNFNPNPSVEYGTTGYSPLVGTEQVTQVAAAWSGQYGLQVVTPGTVAGEGIATPYGSVLAGAQGSMSLYIYGDTGTLTVSAIQNPGGHVLGSVPVQPDPTGWQRVELDQLPLTGGDDVFLMVYTTTAQALTFVIDAVQYEPESPAHPYVDGDQVNGTWSVQPGADDTVRTGAALDGLTGPAATASYQEFQNSTSAAGGMTVEGAIEITVHGTVFQVGKVTGQMDMSGQQFDMCAVTATGRTVIAPAIDTGVLGLPWVISGGGAITSIVLVTPGSGFAQFAVFASTDPDPAMTLLGANNAGTDNASSATGSYTQVYGTFTPPQQQLDSNGNALWQAAAYMAAGFRVVGQGKWSSGSPNGVNFTQVQVEKSAGPTPGAYRRPRALSTIVKPTGMNYITNPSMEAGVTGWTAAGGATVAQVAGGYQGSYSLRVTVPEAGGSVSIQVPELIFGDVFNASAYINPVSGNIVDVTLAAGGSSVSANPTGYPFGVAGFGSGPYGGVNADSAPMAAGWNYRPWTAFTAHASTVTLTLTPVAVTGATYPLVFNVDCVMVSPGEVLEDYGDGGSDGWQWELGGTPGLSRSYYYERESVAANAVQGVLGMHIPLGLSAYAPEFSVPATQ